VKILIFLRTNEYNQIYCVSVVGRSRKFLYRNYTLLLIPARIKQTRIRLLGFNIRTFLSAARRSSFRNGCRASQPRREDEIAIIRSLNRSRDDRIDRVPSDFHSRGRQPGIHGRAANYRPAGVRAS